MTNSRGLRSFLSNYLATGLVSGGIFAIVGCVTSICFYANERAEARLTRDFYLGLEGKKADDKEAALAAWLVDSMIKWENLGKSGLNNYQALGKIRNGFYRDLYLAKKETIHKIVSGTLVKGKKITLSDTIKAYPWSTFWKWLLLSVWLLLAFCAFLNFLLYSLDGVDHDRESLLEWPWKKVWTYPAIAVMSPALLPAMMIEAVYRTCKGTLRQTITGRGEDREERRPAMPVIRENTLLEKKAEAQNTIARAKANLEANRERWVNHCLSRMDQAPQIENEIYNLRDRLSNLGNDISRYQRALAQKQKELEDYKKTAAERQEQSRADFLKAFEQIANLAHVEAVEVGGSILRVFTDTIFIKHDGRTYEIGSFMIEIDMFCGQVMKTKNLSSTHPDNYDHPYGHGKICFGATQGLINAALNQKEFAVAVQYILLALQTAEGDKPEAVRRWKEVS